VNYAGNGIIGSGLAGCFELFMHPASEARFGQVSVFDGDTDLAQSTESGLRAFGCAQGRLGRTGSREALAGG